MRSTVALLTSVFLSLPIGSISVQGQDASKANPVKGDSTSSAASQPDDPTNKEPRFRELQKMLTDVTLIGLFTVDRKKMNDMNEERYEIKSIKKMSNDDDLWALIARIKYGDKDVSVPIVTSIKWADQTPVMTMDRLLIPGLGTFSARVVFHDGKYAGTWTHDSNGGHLFGRIEPADAKKP